MNNDSLSYKGFLRFLIVFVFTLTLVVIVVSGTVTKDTTGKEIFNKVIAALGDSEKINNIKNISYKFDLHQITADGEKILEGEFVEEFPDKVNYSILTPGEQYTMIVNGNNGWIISPGQKTEPMPIELRDAFIKGIKRDPLYIIQNLNQYEMQLKPKQNIDDTTFIILLITGPTEFQILIDSKTNLPISSKYEDMAQTVYSEVEEVLSGYKKIDGINVPLNLVGKVNGKQNVEINIREMKFNIEIEKDFFK